MAGNFKIGDSVLVLRLKRKGEITAELKENSFKVALGSMEIICKAGDIAHCEEVKQSKKSQSLKISSPTSKPKAPKSIDLHGFTSEGAKEAVLNFVSNAVMAGHKEVTIIHGHGSGILKDTVHTLLGELDVVASYRHPMNNRAETKVYLF